ncbi:MAG: alpha-hydroxy-acid oxidizing protein, partial [Actinomycetota bacterium]
MLKTIRSVVRLRRFEFNSTTRRLSKCGNVDDLRAIAKRRLPGGVFDYFDGAAEDEVTKVENS